MYTIASFITWSSSFTAPVAILSFISRVRIAFMICVCAGATIFSADCTSSSQPTYYYYYHHYYRYHYYHYDQYQ